jgi:hypothetical protein
MSDNESENKLTDNSERSVPPVLEIDDLIDNNCNHYEVLKVIAELESDLNQLKRQLPNDEGPCTSKKKIQDEMIPGTSSGTMYGSGHQQGDEQTEDDESIINFEDIANDFESIKFTQFNEQRVFKSTYTKNTSVAIINDETPDNFTKACEELANFVQRGNLLHSHGFHRLNLLIIFSLRKLNIGGCKN